jgi:hypothetical protein
MRGIVIEISRTRVAHLGQPVDWQPGRTIARLGPVDADEDGRIVIDQVPAPDVSGMYVLTSSSDGERRVLARLRVL